MILDEPTAVLTPQEAGELYKTLRSMADHGKVVIVISHKMNEVWKIPIVSRFYGAGNMSAPLNRINR